VGIKNNYKHGYIFIGIDDFFVALDPNLRLGVQDYHFSHLIVITLFTNSRAIDTSFGFSWIKGSCLDGDPP